MKGLVQGMNIKYPANDVDINDTFFYSKIQYTTNNEFIQHLQQGNIKITQCIYYSHY